MIHSFLRSIGFREKRNSKEIFEILEDIVRHPDAHTRTQDANGNPIGTFLKYYGKGFGIKVCGDFFNGSEFHISDYFPYFNGSYVSTYEQIELERYAAKDAFAGICDEMRLGVTLIFYVNNMEDVMENRLLYGSQLMASNAVLSGLASGGKILLPIMKTDAQQREMAEKSKQRIRLMQKAREGSQQAMETLTMSDMDTYSMLTRRITQNREDILSVVEGSFIPYGMESDQYMIIGEILSCYTQVNSLTGEIVWNISLSCNDVKFDILINERDLIGEPQIGRRFRGRIQMQGSINFM
ncbi:MAG: DUF3881 family protein [Lachnospiraceae bacterium]|nr:DUF3881 family protein [Lachnospiraceae bacterium]